MLNHRVDVWDISQMDMRKDVETGLTHPPSVRPHLSFSALWPAAPTVPDVVYSKIQQIHDANGVSIIFDVVTHDRSDEPGAEAKVFRCRLTLTKRSGIIAGTLLPQSAGHLANTDFSISGAPGSAGLCWEMERGHLKSYLYHLGEQKQPQPPGPHSVLGDIASKTPVALVPLGTGYPLASKLV
jgi:hypothetical protein